VGPAQTDWEFNKAAEASPVPLIAHETGQRPVFPDYDTPVDFRPVVQPVPDFHFNAPLAHVFEAKIGKGSLLVCGYDLTSALDRRPAARQFRRSLFRYLTSPAFLPKQELSPAWLERTFAPTASQSDDRRLDGR